MISEQTIIIYVIRKSCRIVDHLDDILQQIVIKVLIDWQQEMHGEFLGVYDFHCFADEPVTVSVFVLTVDQHAWLNSGWLVLVQVAAFPCVWGYDLFGFIVDVVNWSCQWLTILEIEGSEHASRAQICLIDNKFLKLIEFVLGFSDDSSFNI